MTTTTTTTDSINPTNTRIGWIGTGVMGRSMCSHLIKAGYPLTIFTRTQSKAQPLLDMGAQFASSPLSVASSSDIVFSIVGYPSDVRSVLIGSSGALNSLRPGGILVDTCGGDRGDVSVIRKIQPVFDCLGKVNYMGGAGKGQFAKLANKLRLPGLDVGLYLDAISTGAAGSKSLDLYGNRILGRDLEAGFFVNHFVKDLGICIMECQNMGLALPGLALAHQLYISLQAHGEGNLGTQALILALEQLNNVSLETNKASSS
ncbi:hypothetical protein MKW92_014821 [Papaver armeniacum]|nr:hypothetical protein MKW92_014821 [Papaver armeniacum]